MRPITHVEADSLLIPAEVLARASMARSARLTVRTETGRIIIESHDGSAEPATTPQEGRVILFGRIDDLLLAGEGG
ncbi:MAG: hypothetical protein KJ621_04530 [Proteobacteria bacterium]|nr:hypothetical protein [Pseudomonadota bacterium]MBU1742665.1 hypothetical protein [Pseudomonadota bacterium]